MREGKPAWEAVVKPSLEASLFGAPHGREAPGLPREFADLEDEPELDEEELIVPALRVVAALLDLSDVVLRTQAAEAEGTSFTRQLVWAFNGATKVVSTLLAGDWNPDWPEALARQGRSALGPVLTTWQRADLIWSVKPSHLAPLDEAWLTDADPARAPEADREAERGRRAEVTEDTRQSGDFVLPPRYADVRLERLAESPRPEHQACVEFARKPSGVLVLKGEFRSALHGIQHAIGRFWFVDELETVRALRWHDLVESNLMAQNRAHWNVRRLLLRDLMPVLMEGGERADPGYADRLLAYRLEKELPTVVTLEFPDLEVLALHDKTLELLRAARTIELPRLEEKEARSLGLEF